MEAQKMKYLKQERKISLILQKKKSFGFFLTLQILSKWVKFLTFNIGRDTETYFIDFQNRETSDEGS